MKSPSCIAALALVLAASIPAYAADKQKEARPAKVKAARTERQEKSEAVRAPRTEKVALTGSYIKTPVRRNGVITDGPNAVVVLDRTAIENSGAADLKQVLIHRGIH